MMKNEYQKMMAQIKLSDCARNDFFEQLEQRKKASQSVHPLRVALIAACACLALVGSVFAAGYLSSARIGEQVSNENEAYYRVEVDLEPHPVNSLSEALQADLAAGGLNRSFNSRDTLEQYLGIPLIRSTALEQAGIVEGLESAFLHGFNLRPELAADPNARYVLTGTDMSGAEMSGTPEILKVTAHRVIENAEVYIDARIITDTIDLESLKDGLLGEEFKPVTLTDNHIAFDENGEAYWVVTEYTSAEHKFTTSTYTMSNGIEATIVTAQVVELWSKDGERRAVMSGESFREYAAYFVSNGVLYTVRPYAVANPSLSFPNADSDMLAVLKEVLDTFE